MRSALATGRAARCAVLATVILIGMTLAGSGVATAQDTYVDGPIAEGVSEGPDPSRPIEVSAPAGEGTIDGAMIGDLGRLLASALGAAMR